jgi:hypothetical protein
MRFHFRSHLPIQTDELFAPEEARSEQVSRRLATTTDKVPVHIQTANTINLRL